MEFVDLDIAERKLKVLINHVEALRAKQNENNKELIVSLTSNAQKVFDESAGDKNKTQAQNLHRDDDNAKVNQEEKGSKWKGLFSRVNTLASKGTTLSYIALIIRKGCKGCPVAKLMCEELSEE